MRIFFLYYEYDPRVKGGMGGFSHVWQLAKNWSALGHEVIVFSPTTGPADYATPAVVVRVPALPLPFLRPLSVYCFSFVWALFFAFRKKADLLYVRDMFSPLIALLSRIMGALLFIELNGDALQGETGMLRRSWIRMTQRLNFSLAKRVVTVTEGLRQTIIQKYELNGRRVVTLPNGADTELFFPRDKAQCRRTLDLPEDAPIVGFVGTFYNYQGIDILIRAAPAILGVFPKTLFLMVGDGVERKRWEAMTKEQGVGAAFLFTGQVPYERVPLYINAFDVAVTPFRSFRGETSPLKLMDCWACATAVVSADIPSLQSFKTGEAIAMFVTPDDPQALKDGIVALLSDRGRLERLGQAGLHYVLDGRTWKDVARQILLEFDTARLERI